MAMVGGEAGGILPRSDGATIAYAKLAGKSPGVVFLHGFKSDMNGDKALAVEAFCRAQGRACVRYDGFGHGRSSGRFEDGTIGRWVEDALAVIDELTEGPQVLVGSSMGGWLMLLAALARPGRVAGLLGLAAAPDFTEDLIRGFFTAEHHAQLETEGRVLIDDYYGGEPYPVTRALLDEAQSHLLLGGPIAIRCPVRLIHGQRDADVPWETSLRLADRLAAADVAVTLVKSGEHRLSRPKDLARLRDVLDGLLRQVGS